MAAGFDFNGTDINIALADAAGYDVSPNGDSFAISMWINPDTRTTTEVLLERTSWFDVYLEPDSYIRVEFGDGSVKRFGPIQDSVKTHLLFNLVNQTAIATGTADTNVTTLLIDLDADWYTNGIDASDNDVDLNRYMVYNRTDRTFDTGTVIADLTMVASATTVDIAADTILATGHVFVDGCPVNPVGDDVPAGLVVGTIVYVGDVDGDNIYLYDTAANAVTNDGSTGLVNLTDVGSGAFTLRAREDAIQLNSDLCPDGNEVVMVFSFDWAATFTCWIDGVRQGIDESVNHFNTPADSAGVITVGSTTAGAEWYDGRMNNVVYWTPGVVTDTIATAIYNKGTELTYAATILIDGAMTAYSFWAFDDSAASTAVDNDEGTAARDGTASENTSGITFATLDETLYPTPSNVLTITAAGTIPGPIIVESFRWSADTAGDDLVVNDGSGDPIFVSKADINNFTDVHYMGLSGSFDSIVVATIDTGTLYIYLQ